jgi:hypothetical protein
MIYATLDRFDSGYEVKIGDGPVLLSDITGYRNCQILVALAHRSFRGVD